MSHTVTYLPIFTTLGEMTDANKVLIHNILGAIRQTVGYESVNLDLNLGSLSVKIRRLGGGLPSPSTV